MHERPEKEGFTMKMKNLRMGSILLAVLFSVGCATGGRDYYEPRYYPGYYPPEYPYLDYDPFHPYYSNPSGEPREKTLEQYQKTFKLGGEK
jgi:hypothetical protein